LGARPHCLVICVVTPLSSRNFSFSVAIVATVARNSWRRRRLASLSRSAAWRDFFQPQTHCAKGLADSAATGLDAALLQELAQFGQVLSGCSRNQPRNRSCTAAVIRLSGPCRDCGTRFICKRQTKRMCEIFAVQAAGVSSGMR
jgi:hypothetical protein